MNKIVLHKDYKNNEKKNLTMVTYLIGNINLIYVCVTKEGLSIIWNEDA